MTVSEEQRLELFHRLSEQIGEGAANTLMESLPPFSWHDVATKDDLKALKEWTEVKFERVDAQFVALSAEFRTAIAELSANMTNEIAGLSKEISGLSKEVSGLSMDNARQTWVFVSTVAALAVAVCATIAGGVFFA